MKIIATIFQCKRVAMPYFFIKYCVPLMRKLSAFDFEIYLIQHLTPTYLFGLETSNITGLEKVEQWTKEGKFYGAHIVQHSEVYKTCPALPSYKLGVEIFLREKGDLHIWLEDDAMIMDDDPKSWFAIKSVGTYRVSDNIPIRHTITTRSFDIDILHLMNTEQWNLDWSNKPLRGHPVYFMTKCCKTLKTMLNPMCVAFYHFSSNEPRYNRVWNLELVKSVIPEEEQFFLNLDRPNLV